MKKFKTDTDTPVSFVCQPELKEDIAAIAASEGISASDVIRRAVMFDVRRRKAEASDVGSSPEKGF